MIWTGRRGTRIKEDVAKPLDPSPEVLDIEWWMGLWCWRAPTIKELAGSDDPRDVRKALEMALEARREIMLDVAKGKNTSYIIKAVPAKHYGEVAEALAEAERAAAKARQDPRWRLLDAVEGRIV